MATPYKISFQGKTLQGTFNASLNGKPFRLNPLSISMDYMVRTSQTPTIGGMVVQVFGVEMGDLHVAGTFGAGGWEEQVQFLEEMKALGQSQTSPLGQGPSSGPFRFIYPQRNYDFMVYLKAYSSKSGLAVDYQNANFAPDWQLTLFIDSDNTGGKLLKVATNAYIERLNAGFGYAPNKYMGIINSAEVESFLASQGYAHDIQGYINSVFSVGANTGTGGSGTSSGSGSGYTSVTSAGSNENTIWDFFTSSKGLSAIATAGIMGNWQTESGFNPNALQPSTVAPPNYTMQAGIGYGLAQWTSGGRQAGLAQLAKTQNLPISDIGVQLNYAWQELNNSYQSVLSAIQQATTPEAAANAFYPYEGYAGPVQGQRASQAQQIYQQYQGT